MSDYFFHVTERENVLSIQTEGFLGGWGDLGFGVYFYGSIASATDYAARGGWDGKLEDPVILAVTDPEISKIEAWELDPAWESELYEDMSWFEMQGRFTS